MKLFRRIADKMARRQRYGHCGDFFSRKGKYVGGRRAEDIKDEGERLKVDIQTGPSRIIRMKFGPQTFGGGDLRLQRPKSERQMIYSGKEWPGNYVLNYIFYTARLLSGPDFTVFPRQSLERLTQDLDYTLALYGLAGHYFGRFKALSMRLAVVQRPKTADEIDELEKLKGKFVKAVLCPSSMEPLDSVDGYEKLMNNFSSKLGWGIELVNCVVEEKLGVKPEESGLAYKPRGLNWRESPSALLGKRRQLFMIFETLVCEHGVGIRELTA